MPEQRFAYEPVHDLRSGRLAGVEVVPRHRHDTVAVHARDRGWSARQIAELDASTAVSAVVSTRSAAGVIPVQIDVAADTVLYARDRLNAMLGGAAVAPLLEITAPIAAAAPAEYLVPALAELRRNGFRIALDGAGRAFGPELIAAVRPDLVKLEPHLAADGVPDIGTDATVRAVLDVARSVGVAVAATGVRDPQRLVGLHRLGVTFAQGPLLGEPRLLPEPAPTTFSELVHLLHSAPADGDTSPAPAAPDRPALPAVDAPAIHSLTATAVTLPHDALVEAAREALDEHPGAAGLVLLDDAHQPVGYVDRSRFLLNVTGQFGHALWADKPVFQLADPPRAIDERTPLPYALELTLSDIPARRYDDLVVVGPDGSCRGVVAVAELWRHSILPNDVAPAAVAAAPPPREETQPVDLWTQPFVPVQAVAGA